MTTEELRRKRDRIVLDLEELSENRSLDNDSREIILKAILVLDKGNFYSTDV